MEYCPICRAVRNMRVSSLEKEGIDSKGKKRKITIKSYHCMTCGSFVHNEIIDSSIDLLRICN